MAKARYEKFIEYNPNCHSLENNPDARRIFDLLNEDDRIIAAVMASEKGFPALEPNVVAVEELIKNTPNPSVDLSERFIRTAVGRMQKIILAPFGYEPIKGAQRNISSVIGAKYFRSATCYAKTGEPTMRIAMSIEEI